MVDPWGTRVNLGLMVQSLPSMNAHVWTSGRTKADGVFGHNAKVLACLWVELEDDYRCKP